MSELRLRVPVASARRPRPHLLIGGASLLALCLFGCALEHGARVASSSEGGANTGDTGGTGSGTGSACVPLPRSRDLLIFDDDGPTALLPHSPPKARHFLSGRVSEQGKGLPAHLKDLPDFEPERVDEYRYIRIQGSSRSWTIALRGAKSFGIKDRSPVFASLDLEEGEPEPTRIKLTLHAIDQLAFYYELGTHVDSLKPPIFLSIKQGRDVCAQSDTCGAGSSYALHVHDNAFANDAELLPFEEKDVGPFHVVHAGSSERPPRGSADCDGGPLGRTQVIAYQREPLYNPHGCPKLMTSSAPLPGANFGFASRTPCLFNLKQASLGIEVAYELEVTEPIAYLTRDRFGHRMCTPAGDLPADIIASEEVSGRDGKYERRDLAECDAQSLEEPVMLEPGTYTHIFRWDAESWSGPHERRPKNEPFPPGKYSLGVFISGAYALTPESTPKPYGIAANMDIELVR